MLVFATDRELNGLYWAFFCRNRVSVVQISYWPDLIGQRPVLLRRPSHTLTHEQGGNAQPGTALILNEGKKWATDAVLHVLLADLEQAGEAL